MIFQNYLNYNSRAQFWKHFHNSGFSFWLRMRQGKVKKRSARQGNHFSLFHWNVALPIILSNWLVLHIQDRNNLLGLPGFKSQIQYFWRLGWAAITAESWAVATTRSHVKTVIGTRSCCNCVPSVNSVPLNLKTRITPNLGSSLGGSA